MMGDPVQSLSKTVHPEVAGPKLQQNPWAPEIVPVGTRKQTVSATRPIDPTRPRARSECTEDVARTGPFVGMLPAP